MAARDRLLARIRSLIEERRRRPTEDGLSRMLSSSAPDGRTYSDDEAVLEVHHIVVAGFVVYALMVEVLRQLALRPDLLERFRIESVPTLVVVENKAVAARLVRPRGCREIEGFLAPWLN